jgi:RNA polymerase sigma-70 factor (ECF subfamily)
MRGLAAAVEGTGYLMVFFLIPCLRRKSANTESDNFSPEQRFPAQEREYNNASTRFVDRGGAPVEAGNGELLIRLLSRHQEDLFRYIFALMPHEEDARDVLQETSVALYRKFAEYDPAKPFLAWAYRFAYLEVLKQRERNQRGNRHLNPDLIERLAREREPYEPVLQARLQALEHCLDELAPADQDLIRQRYQHKAPTEDLVKQFGTSRRTLFRKLDRIRRLLFDCINRRVAATGLS